MPFDKNDFLLIEYTVKVKDTGTIVDTTDAELAKRENIYESNKIYGPTLIVLGKNWLNTYVEEEISKMSENEEKEIEVPPSKSYGERDPDKVKVFSLREFQRRGYSVNVGDVVEVSGARGVVKQISGGRVVVDFNHPLAGKTLIYKVKVVKKLGDFNEKIKALAVRHLSIPSEEISVDYSENEKKLLVKIPGKYIARENLSYAKLALAADVFELFKDNVSILLYQEEIRKPQ
ncbi:MAG: peptidylprolyl isomerase [Desulfurococcaceae archaeon]|jgi:peptidylprolyl isomerase